MTLLYFMSKPWSFLTYITRMIGVDMEGGIRVAVFSENLTSFSLFHKFEGGVLVLPIDDTHLYFMTIE